MGEDEYKKIKETVFTYKEAEKYIKCDILGFNVGLKTYSSNEISNLPKQITYEKGGYIYTYVSTENSPPTFNGVELPNDDIITKDGQVISTKTYGYKLVYTNEPKISTGIVFVSPIEGAGKASWKSADLVDELASSGVKYSPDDVVAVAKTADGKLVWLENGNSKARIQHILDHADDFAKKGVQQDKIQDLVMESLTNGKVVDYQGRGTGRPIYEVTFEGKTYHIAITVGDNGYIVGANPTTWP
ncbi:hypothetical protein [Clostridium scatologenes]|uniref:Uncharacterized protein n=1 Tax=Clostridium scatologenes TaxID=1548 RepID=A0A0E3GRL1_CLOSL|nr:hypothetical protein [Clostridium scatologenes]AKA70511.1 hypothetical protein CSCA_3386 [Clostridium scatologenes]